MRKIVRDVKSLQFCAGSDKNEMNFEGLEWFRNNKTHHNSGFCISFRDRVRIQT
jgi:hypothetical protein